uniref:Putative lectin/glucanase superfamily protein n=1 Tax=viral metagenome TaxID=1070528 RepID=A0A6M3LQD2_9ZZZZ
MQNHGTPTAITTTVLNSGLAVPTYNGSTSKIAIGDMAVNIFSALMWIYPDDNTTRSILDLDGGTTSLELDGSGDLTATGWTTPTRYINGAVANAVTQSAWSLIAVTTATGIDASNVTLGQEASFFDGMMWGCRFYTYTLTWDEIARIYAGELRWLQ